MNEVMIECAPLLLRCYPCLQKQQATMWQCGCKFHNFATVYLCSCVLLHVFINKDTAYLQMSWKSDFRPEMSCTRAGFYWQDCVSLVFKALAYEKFQGTHKARSREVRIPTCEVLGAAAKKVRRPEHFLGKPRLPGFC